MAGSKRERPAGSGRWELVVYLGRHPMTNKKQYRSKLFRNSDEVMATKSVKKRAAEADVALARMVVDSADQPATNASATFGELVETWFQLVRDGMAPRTRKNVRGRIDNHIKPVIGWKPISNISTADLDAFYAHLRAPIKPIDGAPGKGLSRDSVKKIHGHCSNALELAMSYGWLTTNPALRTQKIKGDRYRPDLPSLTVARMFITAAFEWNPPFGHFLFAAISLGCRRQELCGLRLHDIDFENRVVTIRRKVVDEGGGRVVVTDDTKGHNIRRFPFDAATMEVLKAQLVLMERRAQASGHQFRSDGYLWSHQADGSRPWSPQYATQSFGRLRKGSGLTFRLHDLRHLNGTHLIDMGVPVPTVAYRLGHRRNSTTLDVYAQPVGESDKAAATAIGNRLALNLSRSAQQKYRTKATKSN